MPEDSPYLQQGLVFAVEILFLIVDTALQKGACRLMLCFSKLQGVYIKTELLFEALHKGFDFSALFPLNPWQNSLNMFDS